MKQKRISKQENGITLLALVITIIILLILAGITISAITGDNGIIGNAGQAKEETEIANEKEIVEKATVQAMGNNKYGNIEESELQEQLDKETGEGETETTDVGDEIEVLFKENKRYYLVDKNGNVEGEYLVIEDKNPGDITVGKDGETLDGSEEKPYEIWCIEDLCAFSRSVNEGENYNGDIIKLMTTLNFNSDLSYSDTNNKYKYDEVANAYVIDETSEKTLKEVITDENGVGFIPIGRSSNDVEARFQGTFDGNDNGVKNIYVYTANNAGLFGGSYHATIKNLSVSGNITSTEKYAGGINGNGTWSSFYNCYNKANVKGKLATGGIDGHGSWGEATLENCINEGKIYSENNYAGGIAGTYAGKISNCYNLGDVEGKGYSAGILGEAAGKVETTNCFNQGNVISTSIVGGGIIADEYAETIVNNCYNMGEITTEATRVTSACSKGIGGTYTNNCYNIGKLVSAQRVCYAIGSGTITNCYYNSTLVGEVEDTNSIEDISKLNKNEFVNLLNSYKNEEGEYPTDWKKWKLGENGYPTFE